MAIVERKLSGWGRYPVVQSRVQRPERLSALQELVARAGTGSLTARGAGRSYGDAALNSKGTTVLMGRLNRMLAFDEKTGLLRCEAGVTLEEILAVFVPRGWFLPVTPGTKHVTVGGAIAFDVHGKNHHCDGAFSSFVSGLKLLTASGEIVACTRSRNANLFRATVGGAGLTGFITEAAVTLRRIETSRIHLRRFKAQDLDDALSLFDEHEASYPYSVAWIDCLARGKALGRSLVMFGRHARRGELDARLRDDPLGYAPGTRFSVPFNLPGFALHPLAVKSFNAFYYARQRTREMTAITDLDPFFYPLDAIGQWNKLYGRRGFIQYQAVFPAATGRKALVEALNLTSRRGKGSFLAVLKRFGAASEGLLSFPLPGYTLALDVPVGRGLHVLIEGLNRIALAHGGRAYLAKDAYLTPDIFREMYPALPDFLEIKGAHDEGNIFSSMLARRLQLHHDPELKAAEVTVHA